RPHRGCARCHCRSGETRAVVRPSPRGDRLGGIAGPALKSFEVALFCRPAGAETGKPRATPWGSCPFGAKFKKRNFKTEKGRFQWRGIRTCKLDFLADRSVPREDTF